MPLFSKWVLNSSMPHVFYLTSLDKYQIKCISLVLLLCVWHAVVGSFWEKGLAIRIDFWALIVFALAFLAIHVILCAGLLSAVKTRNALKKKETKFSSQVLNESF